jgi:hypothetical protein
MEDKKKGFFVSKKYLVSSLTLILMGIILVLFSILHLNRQTCKDILNKALKKGELKIEGSYREKRLVVYFIKNVNTCCRSILKYDELSKNQPWEIIFYVADDYSDIDIENFRSAFDIAAKHNIYRIGKSKLSTFLEKCGITKTSQVNMLLVIINGSKVEAAERF